ncbi:MAG TPA: hypothetical protein VEY71_10270, partial [Chitinophagales bacterium]|nr:hypothetical protein [Chitinophagales bacterium]
VTPFAADRDREKISKEIDAFNEANEMLSKRAGVAYIDITPVSRNAQTDPTMTAADGLHPSGKMYGIWAAMLAPYAAQALER